jgi:hypothetical protein
MSNSTPQDGTAPKGASQAITSYPAAGVKSSPPESEFVDGRASREPLQDWDPTAASEADLEIESWFPELDWDHPAWRIEPVRANGRIGDAEFWETGPAVPDDAVFRLPEAARPTSAPSRPSRRRPGTYHALGRPKPKRGGS